MLSIAVVIALSLLIAEPVTVQAQQPNFDDILDSADDEFKEMKRKADDEFSALKQSVDDEFGELLENAWREFELARGLVRDETPKPDTPPVAHPEEEPVKPEPEKKPVEPPPEEAPVRKGPVEERKVTPPTTREPSRQAPEARSLLDTMTFDFYSVSVSLDYDRRWKTNPVRSGASPEVISGSWKYFSATEYEPFLTQAVYAREQLGLNDWGWCRLLQTIATELYPRATNDRPLFIWFMLVESGYDARIGYNDDRMYVMIPSPQTVYEAPFYEIGNEKYYITNLGALYGEVESLYTYEGKHGEATKRIDFSMASSPAVGKEPVTRTLTFHYNDDYSIPVDLNKRIVDFYEYYPQIDLDIYFGAAVSPETMNSLLEGLRPIIEGKPEDEAANIILRFVQTALAYKTDDDQFAYENYLFPEETLFYPFCDCEDRSFLFSYLVDRLLGLEVVGLLYPGHVATAVCFRGEIPGQAIIFDGKRYTVCDPTYINANVGDCMPHYSDVEPGVILVQGRR